MRYKKLDVPVVHECALCGDTKECTHNRIIPAKRYIRKAHMCGASLVSSNIVKQKRQIKYYCLGCMVMEGI